MRAYREFSVSSWLPCSPAELWAHASSLAGVNRELFPLLRMTGPAEPLDGPRVPVGRRAFRGWILLFGLVPVDYDDLTLVSVEPGRGFHERSRMLSQAQWEHERRVEAEGAGCRVTDRVRFAPRLPGTAWIYRPVFEAVFRLRHRNLRRIFASGDDASRSLDARP